MTLHQNLEFYRIGAETHPHGFVDMGLHALLDRQLVGRILVTLMPRQTAQMLYPDATSYAQVFKATTAGDVADYRAWLEHEVGVPRIATIRVMEPFRRQGVARALCLEAARWMGELRMPLGASGKCDAARWKKLCDDASVPTMPLPCGRPAIWFTDRRASET